MYFLWHRPFTWYIMYHNFWPCDLDLEVWPTFEKLKPQTRSDRAFILHSWKKKIFVCLVTKPYTWYHNVYLVTLTFKFDLLVKNSNLGCYSMMVATQRASLSSDNSYCTAHPQLCFLWFQFNIQDLLLCNQCDVGGRGVTIRMPHDTIRIENFGCDTILFDTIHICTVKR